MSRMPQILMACFLLLIGLMACDNHSEFAIGNLVMPGDVDLGQCALGGTIRSVIDIGNPTPDPIVIQNIVSSCGCTVTSESSITVEALGSAQVTVLMSPGDHPTARMARLTFLGSKNRPRHLTVRSESVSPFPTNSIAGAEGQLALPLHNAYTDSFASLEIYEYPNNEPLEYEWSPDGRALLIKMPSVTQDVRLEVIYSMSHESARKRMSRVEVKHSQGSLSPYSNSSIVVEEASTH